MMRDVVICILYSPFKHTKNIYVNKQKSTLTLSLDDDDNDD